MSRAGKNVREMALRRRARAIVKFAGAGAMAIAPFWLTLFTRSPQAKIFGFVNLPIWVYLICFAVAAALFVQAQYLWRRAGHADQGAKAEEDIADILTPLSRQGWKIEYGVRDRAVGDVDIFLLSPKGLAYTIDVKSHKGYVYSDKEQLYRKMGQSSQSFEKNFLTQAKNQALAMKRQKRLSFVTPMIVFSTAKVGIHSNPIAGVYVVEGKNLLTQLRSLG